jgi:hypothetical protein
LEYEVNNLGMAITRALLAPLLATKHLIVIHPVLIVLGAPTLGAREDLFDHSHGFTVIVRWIVALA